MSKKLKKVAVVVLAAGTLCLAGPALAVDFDFSGVFKQDNDVVRLGFTVGEASTITIFSSSWDDGGFDPILSIWGGTGALLAEQDDGGLTGTAVSKGTTYDYGKWDSYYTVDLTAGTYTASIAQYDNFAAGTTLGAGFLNDSDPHFTTAWGFQPNFNGVDGSGEWMNGRWNYNDPRNGYWNFHILNVAEASQQTDPVPEPGTLLLLGTGLVGLAGSARRRTQTT